MKVRFFVWLLLPLVVGASGCATRVADPRVSEANYPMYCDNKAQCDIMWQRAQIWVVRNSGYKLQLATDAVIQTFGPFGSKVDLAFEVVREPMADGGGKITIRASCDNIFGCQPSPIDAKLRFKAYLREGAPS